MATSNVAEFRANRSPTPRTWDASIRETRQRALNKSKPVRKYTPGYLDPLQELKTIGAPTAVCLVCSRLCVEPFHSKLALISTDCASNWRSRFRRYVFRVLKTALVNSCGAKSKNSRCPGRHSSVPTFRG
ncbi:unnamed protein product, partial [Iphiclides podalirius]